MHIVDLAVGRLAEAQAQLCGGVNALSVASGIQRHYLTITNNVIDEQTLVQICKTSFRPEEIKKSKSLLFDSISTDMRKILRKHKGKEERDLADIINLFKSAEPDEIPIFVARQLEKLPPITFDHLDVTKLLKDLVRIQATVDDMKSNYATVKDLKDLKAEVLQMKNNSFLPTSTLKVNKRRGAWLLDDGPMEVSHMMNSSINESCTNNDTETDIITPRYRNMRVCLNEAQQRSQAAGKSSAHESPVAATDNCKTGLLSAAAHTISPVRIISQLSALNNKTVSSVTAEEQRSALPENDEKLPANTSNARKYEEWQQVTNRKKRPTYRYLGQSGVARDLASKFKAADKKVPVFITNVHIDTTEEDITTYILNKTNEMVKLEKIIMKRERGHIIPR
ncbi:hypothetical protein evm_014067 [Chilo suppressalis]|nr:hypothetical protein evm_014067 [Chilo suppressalis]